MKKSTSIIIMIVLIAIILTLLSILLYNLNKKTDIGWQNTEITNITPSTENIVVEKTVKTNAEEIKISPNTTITFLKCYKKCGHTVKTKEIVTENMVNLTQEDFSKLYSDWQINKFTNSEIELYKEFDGSCGEHYLVKSLNGFIAIYTIKGDNSIELNETTDIAVKYLALEDMNELENGIILYGKENLNSYIENFE